MFKSRDYDGICLFELIIDENPKWNAKISKGFYLESRDDANFWLANKSVSHIIPSTLYSN